MRTSSWFLLAAWTALLAGSWRVAPAAVVEVKIDSREAVLDGQAFGEAGAYEKLAGTVTFAFDPGNAANRRIVDLELAPKNAHGSVLASANFMVLQPKRAPEKSVAVLEVSNRGGKALLPYFQNARFGNDPAQSADFGDGLLMRRGYTLMWVGWQADVPSAPHALRLEAPIAKRDGQAIEGWLRADWTLDRPATTLALAHRGHVPYSVVDPEAEDSVLTERDGREARRRVVPRGEWRFAKEEGGKVVPDTASIYKPEGFRAGKIYELTYRSRDPKIVGLGLAAVRDFMAYAKYDARSPFRASVGIAFGVSQSGRFLRHYLYQGFNTDERERQVFDGMLIHAAGAGRGSFNHRFAQPSRDAHRYSTFFYPTDLFPFSGREQRDPETCAVDALMPKRHAPKIFYTNTGYEYWGRAAALIHTKVDATSDLEPLPNERLYHLAGGQHFVVPFPPQQRLPGEAAFFGNPLDYMVNLRALLPRLVDWVVRDREPPPSALPRLKDGSLTTLSGLRFNQATGMAQPPAAHVAYRVDYGPRWAQGIIDREPPEVGKPFPSLVPQVDEFGNELGGVRNVELRVPLATYTPWCMRAAMAGPREELLDFYGTVTPLPKASGGRADPRGAIDTLYPDKADYTAKVRAAAQALQREGFLLDEDIPRVVERAEQTWNWAAGAR